MIYVNRIECDVVDVCNLSCKNCGHIAPMYCRNYYTLEEFRSDFIALSKVFRCKTVSLMGGEPLLLGEKLIDYIDVLKKCGVCSEIKLVTNGILMEKFPDVVKAFDCVWVSLYEHRYKENIKKWFEKNRNEYSHVYLNLKLEFADSFSLSELSPERSDLSWKKCDAKTNCNAVYKGFYYRCSPAAKFHKALDAFDIKNTWPMRCNLHEENLEKRLDFYINSPEKLTTCSHCFGHLEFHPWKEEDTLKIV